MIVERIPLPRAVPNDARVFGLAAAAEFEALAQIALFNQTVRVTLDGWTRSAVMALPVAPLLDPLSVKVKVDGVAFDSFAVITGNRPALRLSGDLPCGVLVIEYVAGFGYMMADLPADILNAIQDHAGVLHDARGLNALKGNGLSPHMARVAARYRRVAV